VRQSTIAPQTVRMQGSPLSALLFVCGVSAQLGQNGDVAPNFDCPERSGKFADPEQCDLFYICKDNIPYIEYCPEGLLFDTSRVNHEKCTLPHKVDCGAREFVQEPSEDKDPRCPKANGVFDHDDESICNKYLQCDGGRVFELPCPDPLIFDTAVGTCVRKDGASEIARICEAGAEIGTVDGFTCPGNSEVRGPQNLVQAHPTYPHPTDCQYYFVCYHNKEPNKFGCPDGQVFDSEIQVCKKPEEVPECSCWYGCPDNSPCGQECNADCSCE